MDGGAWWAAVHGVAKGRTRLNDFTFPFHFHALEKEMATHSSVLAWRIPGTAEPGGLPSVGLHRVGHDWSDLAAAVAAADLEPRNSNYSSFYWNTNTVELGGLPSVGSHRVGHGWSDFAAAAADDSREYPRSFTHLPGPETNAKSRQAKTFLPLSFTFIPFFCFCWVRNSS